MQRGQSALRNDNLIAEHLGRVDLENCGKLNLPVDDLPHGQLRGGHEYRCYHYEFDYWPTHSEDDFWQNAKALGYIPSRERRTCDRRSGECWKARAR